MSKANPANEALRADHQRRAAIRADRAYQDALNRNREAALARQYEAQQRVPSPEKDPGLIDLATKTLRPCFVKAAERVFATDIDLYSFIDEQVARNKEKSGRPTHLETRTVLIILWLHVVLSKEMYVLNTLTTVLPRMSWRTLRDLGVDRDRAGRPTPLRYGKLLDAVHRICAAFDPYAEGLSDDERRQREEALLELQRRLCDRSLIDCPAWRGNCAIDASLKWAHEQPPGAKSKTKYDERAGQPALPLGEVLDGLDPAEAFVDLDPVAQAKTLPRPARGKHRPATWLQGAAWVGRAAEEKSVFGFALNTLTSTDEDGPSVILGQCMSPANVNAADIGYKLVEALYDSRILDPDVMAEVAAGRSQLLGDISSDAAYGMMAERWQLRLRALGANHLCRLHKGFQAGSRWQEVGTKTFAELVLFEDGCPICRCGPDALRGRSFPHYPASRAAINAYSGETLSLDAWRWLASSGWRPAMTTDRTTGKTTQKRNEAGRLLFEREFRSPHGSTLRADGTRGGCEHCVDADGSAVLDTNNQPKPRCCTQASHVFTDVQLSAYQEPHFGTPDWFAIMHAHNRVEASFGIAKNLACMNWGRQFHRLVGLAHEALATSFVVMAYNFHILRTWQYRQDLAAGKAVAQVYAPFDELEEAHAAMVAATEAAVAPEPPPRRPPKGLPMLGSPPAPPG